LLLTLASALTLAAALALASAALHQLFQLLQREQYENAAFLVSALALPLLLLLLATLLLAALRVTDLTLVTALTHGNSPL